MSSDSRRMSDDPHSTSSEATSSDHNFPQQTYRLGPDVYSTPKMYESRDGPSTDYHIEHEPLDDEHMPSKKSIKKHQEKDAGSDVAKPQRKPKSKLQGQGPSFRIREYAHDPSSVTSPPTAGSSSSSGNFVDQDQIPRHSGVKDKGKSRAQQSKSSRTVAAHGHMYNDEERGHSQPSGGQSVVCVDLTSENPPEERRRTFRPYSKKDASRKRKEEKSIKAMTGRMITVLIEDYRSQQKSLTELRVPLRDGDGNVDGYWVDAKHLGEILQTDPSRIDGPAKVYSMRGSYRQYFLRVSHDGASIYSSASLLVTRNRVLQIYVEGWEGTTVAELPPPAVSIRSIDISQQTFTESDAESRSTIPMKRYHSHTVAVGDPPERDSGRITYRKVTAATQRYRRDSVMSESLSQHPSASSRRVQTRVAALAPQDIEMFESLAPSLQRSSRTLVEATNQQPLTPPESLERRPIVKEASYARTEIIPGSESRSISPKTPNTLNFLLNPASATQSNSQENIQNPIAPARGFASAWGETAGCPSRFVSTSNTGPTSTFGASSFGLGSRPFGSQTESSPARQNTSIASKKPTMADSSVFGTQSASSGFKQAVVVSGQESEVTVTSPATPGQISTVVLYIRNQLAKEPGWEAFVQSRSQAVTMRSQLKHYHYIKEKMEKFVSTVTPDDLAGAPHVTITKEMALKAFGVQPVWWNEGSEILELVELYGPAGKREENPQVRDMLDERPVISTSSQARKFLALLRNIHNSF